MMSFHVHVIEQYVLGLGWLGRIMPCGINCGHLEYSMRVEVVYVKHIEWEKKMEDKFMYWRFRLWPFHVQLKVVQSTMVSMLLSSFTSMVQYNALKWGHTSKWMLLWKRKGKSVIL